MAFISYVYTYKFGIFIAKISNITVGKKPICEWMFLKSIYIYYYEVCILRLVEIKIDEKLSKKMK